MEKLIKFIEKNYISLWFRNEPVFNRCHLREYNQQSDNVIKYYYFESDEVIGVCTFSKTFKKSSIHEIRLIFPYSGIEYLDNIHNAILISVASSEVSRFRDLE